MNLDTYSQIGLGNDTNQTYICVVDDILLLLPFCINKLDAWKPFSERINEELLGECLPLGNNEALVCCLSILWKPS